jgi:CRP-like cAMP-binding protein
MDLNHSNGSVEMSQQQQTTPTLSEASPSHDRAHSELLGRHDNGTHTLQSSSSVVSGFNSQSTHTATLPEENSSPSDSLSDGAFATRVLGMENVPSPFSAYHNKRRLSRSGAGIYASDESDDEVVVTAQTNNDRADTVIIRRKRGERHDTPTSLNSRSGCDCCPCLPIIDPSTRFRAAWDVAVVTALLYNLVEIPIRVGFEFEAEPWSAADVFNLLVDLFFLGDVIVNFRTGFYEDGFFIADAKRIAARYMSGWFWIDFPTSIPTTHIINLAYGSASDAESGSDSLRLPRLLRLFRIARLFKMLRFIKLMRTLRAWDTDIKWAPITKGLKFLSLVFFTTHAAACMMFYIALIERNSDGSFADASWITRYMDDRPFYNHGASDPRDLSFNSRYAISFYWALTTISTIGYGDIVPQTELEISFTCVIMFIGSCVFGYMIGNISRVVQSEEEHSRLLRKKIKSINEYMRYRQLPKSIKDRIRSHYNFAWKRLTVYDEQQILEELPLNLRTQIALHLNESLIQTVPLLADMVESQPECTALLTTLLRPLQITRGQYIYKRNDVGTEMYFVSKGEVEVVGKRDEVVCILSRGTYFGVYALLSDEPAPRVSSIRTRSSIVDLYSLSKGAFEKVLHLYPGVADTIFKKHKQQWDAIYVQRKTKTRRKSRNGYDDGSSSNNNYNHSNNSSRPNTAVSEDDESFVGRTTSSDLRAAMDSDFGGSNFVMINTHKSPVLGPASPNASPYDSPDSKFHTQQRHSSRMRTITDTEEDPALVEALGPNRNGWDEKVAGDYSSQYRRTRSVTPKHRPRRLVKSDSVMADDPVGGIATAAAAVASSSAATHRKALSDDSNKGVLATRPQVGPGISIGRSFTDLTGTRSTQSQRSHEDGSRPRGGSDNDNDDDDDDDDDHFGDYIRHVKLSHRHGRTGAGASDHGSDLQRSVSANSVDLHNIMKSYMEEMTVRVQEQIHQEFHRNTSDTGTTTTAEASASVDSLLPVFTLPDAASPAGTMTSGTNDGTRQARIHDEG